MFVGKKGNGKGPRHRCFRLPVETLRARPQDPPSALRSSIVEFGILAPITVAPLDGYYVILDGKKRFQVARELGMSSVPVVSVEASAQQRTELGKWYPELSLDGKQHDNRVHALLAEAARRGLVTPDNFSRFEGMNEEQVIKALKETWEEQQKGDGREDRPQGDVEPEDSEEEIFLEPTANPGECGLEQLAVDNFSVDAEGAAKLISALQASAAATSVAQEQRTVTATAGDGEPCAGTGADTLTETADASPEDQAATGDDHHGLYQTLTRLFETIRARSRIHGVGIERFVQDVVKSHEKNAHTFLCWQPSGTLDPVADHSLLVAKMCIHVASALTWTSLQTVRLGVAGLLHDVGLVAASWKPSDAAGDRGDLVDREPAAHVDEGARLIQEARTWGLQVQSVALDHHERWDGSGGPRKKQEKQVDLPGRIVGLLDTFALLVNPWSGNGMTPHDAVLRIGEMTGAGLFDPVVYQAFLSHFSEWPVGSVLRLTGGELVRVVGTDPNRPASPRLKILEPENESNRSLVLAGADTVAEDLSLTALPTA